jgi:hypothetical protein
VRFVVLVVLFGCGGNPPQPAAATPTPPIDAAVVEVVVDADITGEELDRAFADPWESRPGDGHAATRAMKVFVDRMCECRDSGCGNAVNADMEAWSKEMHRRAHPNEPLMQVPPPENVDPEVWRLMQLLGKRYGECFTRALKK